MSPALLLRPRPRGAFLPSLLAIALLAAASGAAARADDDETPPPSSPPAPATPAAPAAPAATSAPAPPAMDPRPAAKPAATPTGAEQTDWRTGDMLEIKVLSRMDLSCTVRVLSDGTIDVPFAGRFQMAKRTAETVRGELEQAFAKIERSPQVAITVASLSPDEFYVLGEAAKAGVYTVPRTKRVSFLQALGMAGGFTAEADFAKVQVVPAGGGEPKTFDASPSRISALSSIYLANGDTIVVPSVGRLYIMGQVNRTGGFAPPAGERLTLTRAIALAGGFSRLADMSNVLVTWRNGQGETVVNRYNVKAILNGQSDDVVVFPGNLISVPERPF